MLSLKINLEVTVTMVKDTMVSLPGNPLLVPSWRPGVLMSRVRCAMWSTEAIVLTTLLNTVFVYLAHVHRWENYINYNFFFLMLWNLGALQTQEEIVPPRAQLGAYPSYANNPLTSSCNSPIQPVLPSLYIIPGPGTRQPEIKQSPEPATVIQIANPKLFPCPALPSCGNPRKALAYLDLPIAPFHLQTKTSAPRVALRSTAWLRPSSREM